MPILETKDAALDAIFEATCYNLCNSVVRSYPFPHFFTTGIFPPAYYQHLINTLPLEEDYVQQGNTNYHGRRFGPTDFFSLREHLLSREFVKRVVSIFAEHFPKLDCSVIPELRLIRDGKDYYIGPHTDAPWKLISLLFYFATPGTPQNVGTSFYVPRDRKFRCAGGPHHKFELFYRVNTLPFVANACLGFLKTDRSFHGVEPITIPVRRDVLLWNLYRAPGPDSPTPLNTSA